MRGRKRRHWFWNLLLIVSLLVCLLAFVAHYRNWTRLQPHRMQLLSGVYYLELSYAEMDSLVWVEKIPHMERERGFSAGAREKGVFRDSLIPGRPVYVFVDNLRQAKIKIRYRDTLTLYLNFADSTETVSVFRLLEQKLQEQEGQVPE
jgi:hypothetical protein